jgi:hypothetical protein
MSAKKVILGSGGVAALVALVALADLAIGLPFGRKMMWDIMFLVSAGAVLYMAYDAYQDLK